MVSTLSSPQLAPSLLEGRGLSNRSTGISAQDKVWEGRWENWGRFRWLAQGGFSEDVIAELRANHVFMVVCVKSSPGGRPGKYKGPVVGRSRQVEAHHRVAVAIV